MQKYKQQGINLIEILITISISLLVLTVVMEIYLATQHSLQLQTSLLSIQNNARSAAQILTTAIHHAGNIGCAKLTKHFPIYSSSSYSLNFSNKLIGTDHAITIKYMGYPSAVLTENMHDNHFFYTNSDKKFSLGDVAIISNCKQAEIFLIKKINFHQGKQKITPVFPLHFLYDKHSEVGLLVINQFFISQTKRKNKKNQPIYALYLKEINNHKIELVENVHTMQFTYTVNQAGQFKEVLAKQIMDWGNVVGLTITLHLSPYEKNWYVYAALNG